MAHTVAVADGTAPRLGGAPVGHPNGGRIPRGGCPPLKSPRARGPLWLRWQSARNSFSRRNQARLGKVRRQGLRWLPRRRSRRRRLLTRFMQARRRVRKPQGPRDKGRRLRSTGCRYRYRRPWRSSSVRGTRRNLRRPPLHTTGRGRGCPSRRRTSIPNSVFVDNSPKDVRQLRIILEPLINHNGDCFDHLQICRVMLGCRLRAFGGWVRLTNLR